MPQDINKLLKDMIEAGVIDTSKSTPLERRRDGSKFDIENKDQFLRDILKMNKGNAIFVENKEDDAPDLLKNTVVGNEILDMIESGKMGNMEAAGILAEMFTKSRPNILRNPFASITGANQLEENPSGSKSIDDIIRQADIVEAFTPKDATNVEVRSQDIKPEQDPRYGIPTDVIEELFEMQDNVGRGENTDLLDMLLRKSRTTPGKTL